MGDLRNRIRLIGHAGNTPELRFDKQSSPVTKFRLAVDEPRGNGDEPPPPQWFTVELWGRQAERAVELVSKGASVEVEGRFKFEQWTDRDNKPRYNLIVANADFIVHKDAGQSREAPPA